MKYAGRMTRKKVYIDENCRLCRYAASSISSHDHDGQIELLGFGDKAKAENGIRISMNDGTEIYGAGAVMEILDVLLHRSVFSRVRKHRHVMMILNAMYRQDD